MFAPRSRFDENALVSQTPGPSMNRPRASPIKQGGLTTAGKQRMKGQYEDGEQGLGSPKKLFKNVGGASPMKGGGATPGPSSKRPMAMAPKTPGAGLGGLRSALGDKTNNNKMASTNPFAPRQQPGDGGQQGGKSPKKKGLPGTSPLKSGQKPAVPQTPAASTSIGARTEIPSIGSARGPQPFETPAANVGRKGMMKQKMGEILDAQRFASAGVEPPEQLQEEMVEQHWTDGLTEEEMYPEIEYMPPSMGSSALPEERPEALEGLMQAAELGAMMKDSNFLGVRRSPSPRLAAELPPTPPEEIQAATLKGVLADTRHDKDEESTDEDEPFPDQKILVPVAGPKAVAQGSRMGSSMATSSTARLGSPSATRPQNSGTRPTVGVTNRSGSQLSGAIRSSVQPRSAAVRSSSTAATKPTSRLAQGENGRPVPVSRASSGKPATSRSGSTASPSLAPRARPGVPPPARPLGVKPQGLSSTASTSKLPSSVPAKMKVKRQPHPALLDLENDEVSRMVKEQIKRDEEEQLRELGMQGVGLDLFDDDEMLLDVQEEVGI
ncbi:hypothetical protein BCV69DRAFT_86326 [Microstroma glucosiphilum]|uniref:Uncharacterized protein n=1 Tax=Pseudomicrostroma glucosiphilum TaxID=1684307 RepID=A0A316U0X0_9BASI|nr:hypothetical protein BCV69DRAFT_86326 [Pseudomicrostroma glucosiphilum]PWN18151.1 hypothetical protein BCV69DRAFT_86326 [Pseudomicrostroma glucosiphilum]